MTFDQPSKAGFRRWLGRVRRFWGPPPAADHPLSEVERNPPPETRLQELTRDVKGIPGDTDLGDDVEKQ